MVTATGRCPFFGPPLSLALLHMSTYPINMPTRHAYAAVRYTAGVRQGWAHPVRGVDQPKRGLPTPPVATPAPIGAPSTPFGASGRPRRVYKQHNGAFRGCSSAPRRSNSALRRLHGLNRPYWGSTGSTKTFKGGSMRMMDAKWLSNGDIDIEIVPSRARKHC